MAPIDRAAWAGAYRFHEKALQMLDQYSIYDFWEWFWDAAEQISNAHDDDFARSLVVDIAIDCERKQLSMTGRKTS